MFKENFFYEILCRWYVMSRLAQPNFIKKLYLFNNSNGLSFFLKNRTILFRAGKYIYTGHLNIHSWKCVLQLDDWVLCRVRQKTSITRNNSEDIYSLSNEPVDYFPLVNEQSSTNTNPNLEMLRDSLFKDCPMLPFIFGSQIDFLGKETVSDLLPGNCSNGENLFHSFNGLINTRKRKHGESERNQHDSLILPNKKLTKRDDLLDDLLSLSNDEPIDDMNIYRLQRRQAWHQHF